MKFATNQLKNTYNNINSKSLQYPSNTQILKHKYLKHTIACNFQICYPTKTINIDHKFNLRPKHQMFSSNVYQSPNNFTQLLIAMVVTFFMPLYKVQYDKVIQGVLRKLLITMK